VLGTRPTRLLRTAPDEQLADRSRGTGTDRRTLRDRKRHSRRLPEERAAIRQARAGALLESLHDWLRHTLSRVSKKSEFAKAIGYVLSRWTALTRYRDDGRIEIDNNTAERALRAVALGRKNYLFCGSDAGGERAAAMYSLIGTAKLYDLDPEAYLRHVIERIAEHPINRIEELLPWHLASTPEVNLREAA